MRSRCIRCDGTYAVGIKWSCDRMVAAGIPVAEAEKLVPSCQVCATTFIRAHRRLETKLNAADLLKWCEIPPLGLTAMEAVERKARWGERI